MEVALGSAALVGAGLIWNRVNSSPSAPVNPSGVQSSRVVREPIALNFREEEAKYAKATAVPRMTQIPSGSLSGRRDHSKFVDAPSPYEQQMSRVYKPKEGSKREVKGELDPTTKQDNVFVRSNTSYQTKLFSELQRPVKMHNVNPIATTTGTASQLVGPGIGVGTNIVGDHGLHYGMVRMRPEIVDPTFREKKGGIIPGKNVIDNRQAEVNLIRHAATGFSLGPSGFEKSESTNPEPMKFHAISENYLTSAPGRAVVTGNPGAGGARLEPHKDNTNRGTDNSYVGITGAAGLEAPDSRYGYVYNPSLATDRGHANEFVGIATGEGVSRSGHQRVVDNFSIPAEARNTTEVAKASQVLNISNPGQNAGMLHNNQDMQTTQRQTMNALDVINLSPQLPGDAADIGDDTRRTSRLPNEYRPGGASLASVPDLGGQVRQFESYSDGKLSMRTQRESLENKAYAAPLKAVGVNAPMSYSDILASEGYSNRDLPQSGFVTPAGPPGGSSVETAGIGHFDQRPDVPNTTRNAGGGVGNQFTTNFHIVNKQVDVNPNKIERANQRLDPSILEALSNNELKI
uniref:Uncharacterized protein n=1 Tax=viral metagenome TaxID=1070528 RepID=A0A6C0IYR4_9ZZZZ